MTLQPANLKDLELKTGASAGELLEKIRNLREKNIGMDRIADTQVYISGMFVLRRADLLEAANITHIISVLRGRVDKTLIEQYTTSGRHLHIEVDDDDDENLIEHFQTTNAFIDKAVRGGGNVLVHCAMGISRSATICTAYLIYKKQIPSETAIDIIRESRPIVCPNYAFRQQLNIYYENLDQAMRNLDDVPAYQRYLYKKEVEMSRMAHKAPTINHYGDDEAKEGSDMELKCRKCRRTLALSKSFVDHQAASPPIASSSRDRILNAVGLNKPNCQHHFLDPIVWMKPELEKGEMEGKLECPKCKSKVGSYAWQGMKCSCGVWVTPAISLAKSRVDESRPRSAL
ncbi:tyrosine protein phosphatase yvh1 [Arthrobotrys musiformis]|uniref:protein-tyrosine-phosphatase n=1 Tax=Arthrobotrys musiformis TaxID=47236 RepID=A0AAV9WPT9_9PEZI